MFAYTVHHEDLKILLQTLQPRSVLLIDPNPGGLPPHVPAANTPRQVTRLTGNILPQLETLERHDLGIIANTLEHLDRKTAGIVLARLRDMQTKRFVALAPIGGSGADNQASTWEATDFLAYGMTRMASYRIAGKLLHLYHYAIESYKITPEWLNSKNWAHPERWQP
jgi:hypothetical protein